jgi:serine/threonine protein kinase
LLVTPRNTHRAAAGAETLALGLQSFIAEAKLLARFSHPAMVKVYRFWEADGTGYTVMPYLRGPTLGDVRRSMSQPPTEG